MMMTPPMNRFLAVAAQNETVIRAATARERFFGRERHLSGFHSDHYFPPT
jgi:hypothetical protein